MDLPWLRHESLEFPPVDQALAEPNGLLAVGGDLTEERLCAAYRRGIFPWYEEGQPILWWSPNPRCILHLDNLHISRSLRKLLRSEVFEIRADTVFEQVLIECAAPRAYTDQTWISPDMHRAYTHLHRRGIAHSIEVWQNGQLQGGLYGIALGRVFFGESMFSKAANASKIALVYLIGQLREWNYALVDCQVDNPHLQSLGAELIERSTFVDLLDRYSADGGQSSRWDISWRYN